MIATTSGLQKSFSEFENMVSDERPDHLVLVVHKNHPLSLYDRITKALSDGVPVHVNIMGHYSDVEEETISLAFLQRLNVRKFSLQSAWKISDEFSLENCKGLQELCLMNTVKGSISLKFLSKLSKLKALTIVKHSKHIESIANVSSLHTLHLKSCKIPSLDFINEVPDLSEFTLEGGKLPDPIFFSHPKLKTLKIESIRKVEASQLNLSLPSLSDLTLSSLPITTIPTLKHCPNLNRLRLHRLKNLASLQAIKKIQSLKDVFTDDPHVEALLSEFPQFNSIKRILF